MLFVAGGREGTPPAKPYKHCAELRAASKSFGGGEDEGDGVVEGADGEEGDDERDVERDVFSDADAFWGLWTGAGVAPRRP